MGECRSRGGYRMRVRNKENNWCYEKRLSTSRYEFRRLAFCESPPSRIRAPTPRGEPATLIREGGQVGKLDAEIRTERCLDG